PRKKPVSVNEQQLKAATHIGSPALVTAGPGTGKTATLIRRIEFLLEDQAARPDQMLVLTFSNDATEELRERVAARFGDDVANQIEIATFHGFGMSFLHTHALGLSQSFALLDEAGQEEILNQLIGQLEIPSLLNLRDLEDTVKRLMRHISFVKDRVLDDQPITPELLLREIAAWQGDELEVRKANELLSVFRAYEQAKRALPAVDFADLIAEPIRVMAEQPQLVTALRQKYRWVMVDEYQDVSRTVAVLLRSLCGPDNPPWVVGDMRQAIYRFRGAAPENVSEFHHDFPNAEVFELEVNYRSCPEVVTAANQLGELLAANEPALNEVEWRAGSSQTSLSSLSVAIARVNSDEAESQGIARQVRQWLDEGVRPADIAVLARRNSDVRNIVLTLGAQGIRAATSGLLTAEGAAGDLTAIATLPDSLVSSLPRLVYALGRGRFDEKLLNELIKNWLTAEREQCELVVKPELAAFVEELQRVVTALKVEMLDADAFTMLCHFLFDASDYLRRVLAAKPNAQRTLALSEIISTLSRAASYRFAHLNESAKKARLTFAEQLRGKLAAGAASPDLPAADPDAVRVMTCHASKGLEFPCVIVAGQTLGQGRESWWLPPSLLPSKTDELAQADALLFVGVTRAQRAVVVSCAESKSGSDRARKRAVAPLLDQWQERFEIPELEWPIPNKDATKAVEQITMTSLWGGKTKPKLAASALDSKSCGVKTYLENFVGIRFPVLEMPQYVHFYLSLRLACEALIRVAQEAGQAKAIEQAAQLFAAQYSADKHGQHPHYPIYQRYGELYARRFASAYEPRVTAVEFASSELESAEALPLRFDLIAQFKGNDGATHAFLFRPESLADSTSKNAPDELLWSGLDTAQRAAFLLLKQREADLRAYVFSAADGMIYRYLWNKKAENMDGELQQLHRRWQSFGKKEFTAQINEHACNRCNVRLACPHWLGE
ncbi:MAG: ATP-dependent helicase, partial [Acidobacteria bacterium]|nr:ATP-dependent helicase [Acidobacteriota bacterium]